MIAWTCQLVAACGFFLVALVGVGVELVKLCWGILWRPVREYAIGLLAACIDDLVGILRFILGKPRR